MPVKLRYRNSIGDCDHNPLYLRSLFSKLSQCATQDIYQKFSGQAIVETIFIPISTEQSTDSVTIESYNKVDQLAWASNELKIQCIWIDGCRKDLGYITTSVAWNDETE
jgi:hypothetical protein